MYKAKVSYLFLLFFYLWSASVFFADLTVFLAAWVLVAVGDFFGAICNKIEIFHGINKWSILISIG